MQRLPESELDVMLALWDASEAVPRSYIDQKLSHRNWNVNTVNTYLSRLQDKGFVSCQRQGRVNYYTPLIQRENYLEFESATFLNKLYNNSLKNFIVSLSGSDAMKEEDISELQSLLESMKGGEPDGRD